MMEVCEEMMRWMPKCSKHEWRHKEEKSRWAFVRISVSVRWAHDRPVGFFSGRLLSPYTRPSTPVSKGKIESFSEPELFSSDTVSPSRIRLLHQFCCA